MGQPFSDAVEGEAQYNRFEQFHSSKQAYPSREKRRGSGAMVSNRRAFTISHSPLKDTEAQWLLNTHH